MAAVAALFDRTPRDPRHPLQSGGLGWRMASRNATFAPSCRTSRAATSFPEGEGAAASAGRGVPLADFMHLTKIPIVIYYGDNILRSPRRSRGQSNGGRSWPWPSNGGTNKHGGDALVHCPSWDPEHPLPDVRPE